MKPRTIAHDSGLITRSKVVKITACGKQGYSSKKMAKASAVHSARMTGDDIRAYKCDGCHCWHIGHTPWWLREAS